MNILTPNKIVGLVGCCDRETIIYINVKHFGHERAYVYGANIPRHPLATAVYRTLIKLSLIGTRRD